MKIITLLSVTVLAVIFVCSEAYIPQMIRGRPKGGLLGSPGMKHHPVHRKPVQTPPEQWYLQKLDHFNGADTRYWKQRYFTNDTFYVSGGPLFVQIGGEGTADPIWLVEGAWIDYARTYNAYCVLLEHRFYGKSYPTTDMSVENLQFLSSEQALADLAVFINDLKQKLSFPKVITFGGSYPGSLSAWFRLKYPHLVDGAVASSAPLLAIVDFTDYLKVVDASLRTADPSGACNAAISTATGIIQNNLTTLEGRQKIKNLFKLCDDIDPNIKTDISNLFSTFAGNFEGVVQYNKDNRAFEGAVGTNITIDTLCDIMTDTSLGDPVQRYAEINALLLKVYEQDCQDFKYDKMIDSMRETAWNSSAAEGGRQWTYQTCTEFAFYQSSDSEQQPFGHNFSIDFWTQQCADIFGDSFNLTQIVAAVKRSNIDYGALGIKISRVLFPNGSIDPWHALGIIEDIGPDARAIFINGTAHCANMYPSTPQDPPQLTQARVEISETIARWLQS
uniref:Serine protease K12H4.7 n=1 Tax=Arion vulgaris TaxID=1028688 RepID=A0A0B7A1H0_9EUPU